LRWLALFAILDAGGLVIAIRGLTGAETNEYFPPSLFVGSLCALVLSSIIDRALLLRIRRLQTQSLPWEVYLRKPLWIALGEYAYIISLGLFVGGAIGLAGLPRLGLGLSAIWLGFFLVVTVATAGLKDHIGFWRDGLRLRIGDVEFRVPWDAVERVQALGPNLYQVLRITVSNATAVVDTVDPDTSTARHRVRAILGRDQTLTLPPWIGGMDGRSITRFLEEAARAH
jgi:hypothetical protein